MMFNDTLFIMRKLKIDFFQVLSFEHGFVIYYFEHIFLQENES